MAMLAEVRRITQVAQRRGSRGLSLTSRARRRLPAPAELRRFSRGRPSSRGCLERAGRACATKTPPLRRERYTAVATTLLVPEPHGPALPASRAHPGGCVPHQRERPHMTPRPSPKALAFPESLSPLFRLRRLTCSSFGRVCCFPPSSSLRLDARSLLALGLRSVAHWRSL